jgi:hypothetical protein
MSDPNVQAQLAHIFATLNPALAPLAQLPQQSQPQPQPQHHHQHLAPPVPSSASPPPPPQAPSRPDPRTITTLAVANRYITRYLSSDHEFLTAIRLIRDWQHAQERAWSQQRQGIVTKHAERAETEERLAALLGTGLQKLKATRDDELKEFDRGVHQQLVGVGRTVQKELERLGVPLFGDGLGIEEETLREWRGRVVELLDDLCEEG